jgi:hypothetical protein
MKNRAVQVSAQESLDVRMPSYDGLEWTLDAKPELVHVPDPRVERRMMHEDHRRRRRFARELFLEPLQAGGTEQSASLARHHRVERNQAQRADAHGVLQELAGFSKIGVVRERGTQRFPSVVIPRDQVYGHAQRREQSSEMRIILGATEVCQVSGRDDDVGSRILSEDVRNASAKMIRGIDASICELTGCADVQVADVAEQHGLNAPRPPN